MRTSKNKIGFSVLMSIYYKENPFHLELSLKSILIDQTLLPNEVVIVEDGPLTKELDEVLNKYVEQFPNIIKLFPLKENGGLGNALNYGLTKCKYDLVMRMDTDDIAVPNRFEIQINYMKKNKNVSVVGGLIKEFQEDISENMRLKNMPITKEEVIKYAKFRNPINHMTVCFRKKDILKVGNYQPLFFLEDHYLWSRLLVAGKIIENVPEVLVYARIGNGFSERRGNKNYLKGWLLLQKYLYKNRFISKFQQVRNNLGMLVFILVPTSIRELFYSKLLRNGKENN